MAVAAALAGFRPRWLALTAIAGALAANVLPYAPMIVQRASVPESKASYWRPLVSFLQARLGGNYRVEVVPTANHWESDYLPRAGIPLARGWYRQLDIADNPVLYRRSLTPGLYRRWLRSRAVRYVVVPHVPLEAIDAQREARLAASLPVAWNDKRMTVYELRDATPLLTGPAPAEITRLSGNEIIGWAARAGTYFLRVHFMPYWTITPNSSCVGRESGMTRLTLRKAGAFTLRAIEDPVGLLDSILDRDQQICGHHET
jgi:hypothetical protein